MNTDRKTKVFKPLKPADPREAALFDETVANAIQKMIDGTASGHLQKIGMEWIINKAAGHFGFHENDRIEAMGMGRNFVREQIIGAARLTLINITPEPMPAKTPRKNTKKDKENDNV